MTTSSLKILLTLALVFLAGCSTTPPGPVTNAGLPEGINEIIEGHSWKTCYARISLNEKNQPDWGVDLFLAHAVFAPVLKRHGGQLSRWRFHRRAAPDETGHRLSFIFYSDQDTAISINEMLGNNKLLRRALAENILELFYCNSPDDVTRPGIEDTSDPAWSDTMQRIWPAYIMGVSSLWLGLVEEAAGPVNPDDELAVILQQYRDANDAVTDTWRNEGQHALLHHLNAIFGYQPLNLNKSLSF